MTFVKTAVAFLISVAVTFIAASIANTQFVLAGLSDIGADITPEVRLHSTLSDLVGLAPGYSAVIALSFIIAFTVAWGVKRIIPVLAAVAYPIAGAAAVASALFGMNAAFDGLWLIPSARSDIGFALQCGAGALGGLVYESLRPGSR
jgi:CBS domain containing-hemolysin-like protein